MSITDELRGWTSDHACTITIPWGQLTTIADRIDDEHESAVQEQHWEGVQGGILDADKWAEAVRNDGWIELPKDANGEHIRPGDIVSCDTRHMVCVTEIAFNGKGWNLWNYGNPFAADSNVTLVKQDTQEAIDADARESYRDYWSCTDLLGPCLEHCPSKMEGKVPWDYYGVSLVDNGHRCECAQRFDLLRRQRELLGS